MIRIVIPALVIAFGVWIFLDAIRPTVVVGESKRGTALNAVSGNVQVRAPIRMNVRAEVEGIVTEVLRPPRSEARRVSKGDPLVILDTTEMDLQIAILEADLEESIALSQQESQYVPMVEVLEQELRDLQELFESGKVAQRDLDRLRRDLRRHQTLLQQEKIRLQRQVGRNTAQLELRRRQREKMTIRSPIDGTLDGIHVYLGDYVRVNNLVAEVVGFGRQVFIDVSEEDLGGIESGQEVQVRLLAYGNQLFRGTVGFLAHTANPDTRRRSVVVNLDIDRELLTPGLTGQASIIKGQREDSVLVPRRALVGNTLRVVNDSRISVREVRVGYLGVGQAEILEGLEPGERVVIETPHIFRNGDRVSISEVVPF